MAPPKKSAKNSVTAVRAKEKLKKAGATKKKSDARKIIGKKVRQGAARVSLDLLPASSAYQKAKAANAAKRAAARKRSKLKKG
tara:strand:+ start:481 stop:729 length:249 start_codon:yes stop_codon:yes gene_type:complete